MRIAIVSDAWAPQLNGVVSLLGDLHEDLVRDGHDVTVIEPSTFTRVACPGYRGLEVAWRPGAELGRRLDAARPEAIHIATEGPLGWAARAHCRRRDLRFTTAFHTRFAEFATAMCGLPTSWGYAVLRRFHAASAGVMVPSHGVREMLQRRGFGHLRRWSHGVDLERFAPQARDTGVLARLPRPLFLCVGRVAADRSVDDFLRLDLPGSKVVCGDGPLLPRLRRAHPDTTWLGALPRAALVPLYASADVLVHPSRTDTFGLVMLEALACGTPVAARPAPGPREVIGDSGAGVLDDDLRAAALRALRVPRQQARRRAAAFDRRRVCRQFVANLVPAHRSDWALTTPSIASFA